MEENIDPIKTNRSNEEKPLKIIPNDNNEKVESVNSNDIKIKPKKEIPIEKKPFNEFVNDHLLPTIIYEFK